MVLHTWLHILNRWWPRSMAPIRQSVIELYGKSHHMIHRKLATWLLLNIVHCHDCMYNACMHGFTFHQPWFGIFHGNWGHGTEVCLIMPVSVNCSEENICNTCHSEDSWSYSEVTGNNECAQHTLLQLNGLSSPIIGRGHVSGSERIWSIFAGHARALSIGPVAITGAVVMIPWLVIKSL